MRGKRTTREQNLAEFLVSVVFGGIIAIILCMVLPGIETRVDVGMLIIPFWFCTTITVWSVIDVVETLIERRSSKNEHRGYEESF